MKHIAFYMPSLQATEDIQMYVDDHKIATERYTIGNYQGHYYMDVLPELINN